MQTVLRGSCVGQFRHMRPRPPPRGGRGVRCRRVRASGAEGEASHAVTRRVLGAGAGLMLASSLCARDTNALALGRPLSDRIVSRDLRNSVRPISLMPSLSHMRASVRGVLEIRCALAYTAST